MFRPLPHDIWGYILNIMNNPMRMRLVSLEWNNYILNGCYEFKYHIFIVEDIMLLNVKLYDKSIKKMHMMKKLWIAHCNNITDKSVCKLHQLELLSSNGNITDDGIINVKLKELYCSESSGITDFSIYRMKSTLRSLYCHDCPHITGKSIRNLTKLQYISCDDIISNEALSRLCCDDISFNAKYERVEEIRRSRNIERLPYDIFETYIFPYVGRFDDLRIISKVSLTFLRNYVVYRKKWIIREKYTINRFIDKHIECKIEHSVGIWDHILNSLPSYKKNIDI